MSGKVIKPGLLLALGCVIMLSLVACRSASPTNQAKAGTVNSSRAVPTNQVQTANPKGSDIALHVTADGRLSFVEDRKLTFRTSSTVGQVNVKELDKVTKGKVLAKLETSNPELAVLQAKASLAQAQLAQSQAEVTLKLNEASVASAALALDKIEAVAEIKNQITDMEWRKKAGQEWIKEPGTSNEAFKASMDYIASIQEQLTAKKRELSTLLGQTAYSGFLTYDVMAERYGRLVVQDVQLKQSQFEATQLSVQQAKNSIEYSKSQAESAKKALEVAERQLKEATIVAPFDGVVAKVNVKEGDYLSPGNYATTIAIEIIDPSRMELNVEVYELDIPKVELGQKVAITVDALPDERLEGVVTSIGTLPDSANGVLSYEVKIAFNVPKNSALKAGMAATADIVTAKRS